MFAELFAKQAKFGVAECKYELPSSRSGASRIHAGGLMEDSMSWKIEEVQQHFNDLIQAVNQRGQNDF
ncbi:hypothetical protein C7B65_25615 [Phormidesmis priestleyi ULC007]|uniref:Uncharacterized protein n=1 Tax=Phormidesmis priestleyi ULC007 TaxID=1920490 RepID=A0A2T1D371_9CYAN|nr:hypothetical protein C7B65_25615 [Phormidesmis priestleyi ULC007]PZO45936.1 MAG: hypothetical protein DCF14_24315 [Phormidesmis priestleyi]